MENHALLNSWQKRTLRLVSLCRTSALGGHVLKCPGCKQLRIRYNSCRNRHCPRCQGLVRMHWMKQREAELLAVPYFHVVFTLPDALNRLCLFEPRKVYNLLFETAWSVMCSFSSDPSHLGAATGMIAVLHTWGQNLSLHPHLHCIVPGGGLTGSGKWKPSRGKGKFLFPVRAMSAVFRARMSQSLRCLFPREQQEFWNALFKKPWVVYSKRPFAGAQSVIRYLGGYTHRIAISDHRIRSVSAEKVTFTWKDYRCASQRKVMSLEPMEFIRRFSLHILPRGFVRIRHYGILSCRRKASDIPAIALQVQGQKIELCKLPRPKAPEVKCPCCKKHFMQMILRFDHRGPPPQFSAWPQKLLQHDLL